RLALRQARRDVGLREIQVERAALARHAVQADLAAEHASELAADREAEARTAVAAIRAPVGLLEGLEDDALLLRMDADAAVADAEAHDGRRAIEGELIGTPASGGKEDAERHHAALGELERVRQQIAQDLLHPLRIGADAARELRVEGDREAEALRLGDGPEGAIQVVL